jgi:acetyltransferase-like isoleucine patch superfamily enzyme
MKVVGGRYRDAAGLRELGIGSAGENVTVHETAQLVDVENIHLGSNVRIDPFCILSGDIRIGNYVHIASHAVVMGGAGVTFEDFSGLSSGVKVYSVSDDYSGMSLTNPTVPRYVETIKGAIRIGRHAIVGAGSVILPGCSLADGVAVGALSLVTKPLTELAIYAGTPARKVSKREWHMMELEGRLYSDLEDGVLKVAR